MVLIVVADAVMSLDNVVAVAAAAQDNLLYLVLGLLISVPLLVFASLFVTRLLAHQPLLIDAGAALLGWIAGKTAVADPAVAGFLNTQSFGLVALAPVLGALYVVIQGRRLRAQRQPAGAAAAATPRAGAVAVLAAQALEQAGALAGTAQDAGMAPAQPPHAGPTRYRRHRNGRTRCARRAWRRRRRFTPRQGRPRRHRGSPTRRPRRSLRHRSSRPQKPRAPCRHRSRHTRRSRRPWCQQPAPCRHRGASRRWT